ncbi:MAG: hypothetical protein LBI76_09105 [Comamonas sp.]|jgi:hypothetical protein|nr:hypothetical protein [Comamonas sp.]
MNVADVVGGYFQNLSQQFNYPVPTPGGNIAICPMAEAYQDEGVYVYDIGSGILYTQIDSYVSWFNTSNPTNAGVKLIGKSDDVMGDYFGMLGQRMSYQFLILRV